MADKDKLNPPGKNGKQQEPAPAQPIVEPNSSDFNEPSSPLLQQVEDKPHGHKAVDPNQADKLYTPIPEPQFKRPKVTFDAGTASPINGQTTAKPGEPELSEAEKNQRTKSMVEALIRGYEDINKLAGWIVKPNEKKIIGKIQAGELDGETRIRIGFDDPTGHNIGEIIQDANARIDETMVVTDKFKRNITPPLERIVKKNNWGISDEALVGELLIRDVAMKGAMLFQLNQSMKQVIAALTIDKNANPNGAPVENQTYNTQQPPRDYGAQTAAHQPVTPPPAPAADGVQEVEAEDMGHEVYPPSENDFVAPNEIVVMRQESEQPKQKKQYYQRKTDRPYNKVNRK